MTLGELLEWVTRAPPGTMIEAAALREVLESDGPLESPTPALVLTVESTWQERLWTAPDDTRIGARELAEALGRPRSWVYRRTAPSKRAPLPHRKLDGELVFVIGEVRAWLRDHETVVASVVQVPQATIASA